MLQRLHIVACLVLTLSVVGCASSGTERSKATVASMKQTQAEVSDAAKSIDAALASLNSLQSGGELETKFTQFSKHVNVVESKAGEVRRAADDMRARSADYIKKWQADMAKTDNEELKQAAAGRQAAVQARYNEITASRDAVRDAYQVVHKDLVSLRTYLSNDLTDAGVKASAPAIKKTNDDAEVLRQRASAFRDLLSEVAGGMSGPAK